MNNLQKSKLISKETDDITNPLAFNYNSECVAKWMIEKLISLAITQNDIQQIEEKIPHECYVFTNKVLNAYISSAFVTFDRDDNKQKKENDSLPNFDEEEINNEQDSESMIQRRISIKGNFLLDTTNLFYNNCYRGDNDWNNIPEPTFSDIDRFASSMIDVEKSGRHTTPHLTQTIPLDKTQSDMNHKFVSRRGTNAPSGIKFEKESTKKVKRRPSVDVECYDLPIEEFEQVEASELHIQELRKEKEDELKKIEDERKKIVKKQMESQEAIKEVATKQKEYEKKNITVDANGKIIFIKTYPLEALSSEFIAIKADLKDLKVRRNSISKDQLRLAAKDKNVVIKAPVTDITKKEEKKEVINLSPAIKDKKKPTLIPVTILKQDPGKKDLPPIDSALSLEKRMERGPINPCGSCYELISPEIGVSFIEENKQKTGGKDYFKAFNKYSIENYTKHVKEAVSMQALTSQAFRTSTDYNINNYHPNFTETSSNNFNSTVTAPNYYNKTNNNFSYTKMLMTNQSEFNPVIKVQNMNLIALRSAMENTDDHYDSKLSLPLPNNIFKSKPEREILSYAKSKPHLEPMNLFTQSLLKSDKWGSSLTKQAPQVCNPRLPVKPKLKELEKDFGPKLDSRNRLPRDRERLRAVGMQTFSSSNEHFHNKFLSPVKTFGNIS